VVVNLPFFVVRLVIWHLHDKHISVFLVKNVLGMGLAVQHLHEMMLEVCGVIKPAARTGTAAMAGDPGVTEMRQLTTAAGGADNSKPAETSELAEIHSPQL